jgi:hypothetical protein
MHVLYAVGFVFVAAVLVTGLPYYVLPLSERPHADMHDQLKPGGIWGHGLGIIGTAMILLLLLYSMRKRGVFPLRFGPLKRWLDIHIFFGIMGPLLITLHTAMKFHGIVSISYFSMVAVALSGVFGRYVYMQIPRDARGHALGLQKAQERVTEIQRTLEEEYHVPAETARAVGRCAAVDAPAGRSKLRAVASAIRQDLTMRQRARRLRRYLRGKGGGNLPASLVDEVMVLARESSLLQRRIVLLDSMSDIFHYWHVFHKPFAYVMLGIMVVHVGVTVALGYRWIF